MPRILDVYAALPSITGKLELEYEGELKGGEAVARELIRGAVGKVYSQFFDGVNFSQVVQWFDLGGSLKLDECAGASAMAQRLSSIQGLMEKLGALGIGAKDAPALRASAAEFILEGLYAHRRINRSEEHGFVAEDRKREAHAGEEPRRSSYRRQFN